MFATVPTEKISSGRGSSTLASCCVARKILRSPASASSSARTLDSRPTTNGVIMNGKITTSRMGIIGRRLVSDFSLEVSMLVTRYESRYLVSIPLYGVDASQTRRRCSDRSHGRDVDVHRPLFDVGSPAPLPRASL